MSNPDKLDQQIEVKMTLAVYEAVQRDIAVKNFERGQHTAEAQLLDALVRIGRGVVKPEEVVTDQMKPATRSLWQLVVRLVQRGAIQERDYSEESRRNAEARIKHVGIDKMPLSSLDAFINSLNPDTLEESIVYDYAVKRRTRLREELIHASREASRPETIPLQPYQIQRPDWRDSGPVHPGEPSRGADGSVPRRGVEGGGEDQRRADAFGKGNAGALGEGHRQCVDRSPCSDPQAQQDPERSLEKDEYIR